MIFEYFAFSWRCSNLLASNRHTGRDKVIFHPICIQYTPSFLEMEGSAGNHEVCPQFLDFVPKEREWLVNRDGQRRHGPSEEKELELRLGPPGNQDWSMRDSARKNPGDKSESLLSLGYFSSMSSMTQNISNGSQTQMFSASKNPVGAVISSSCSSSAYGYRGKTQHNQQQTKVPSFLQLNSPLQGLPVMTQEASQRCCTEAVDIQSAEKKAFSPSSATTAVPNSSQKRYFSFSSHAFSCFFFYIFRFWTQDIRSQVTLLELWSMHDYSNSLCFLHIKLIHCF